MKIQILSHFSRPGVCLFADAVLDKSKCSYTHRHQYQELDDGYVCVFHHTDADLHLRFDNPAPDEDLLDLKNNFEQLWPMDVLVMDEDQTFVNLKNARILSLTILDDGQEIFLSLQSKL